VAPAAEVAPLVSTTVKAAMSIAAGQASAAGAVSASVAGLVEGALQTMWITKVQIMTAVVVAASVTLGGTGWLAHQALAGKGDDPKPVVAKPKAPPQDAVKPQKDEEAIQGTWYAVKAELGGDPLPVQDLQIAKLVIDANQVTFYMGDEKNESIPYKLDPTKKPKVMIMTQQNETLKWIYALEGKRLTLCGVEKPNLPAPTEFASPKGSKQFLFVLSRDKPKIDPAAEKAANEKVASAVARVRSQNNLKQLALALHNYHDSFGSLPTAAIYSKDGKPLLSWRVAILPFIEQDNLYKQFKLDEPWDSEHNKKLLAQMPKLYAPVGGAVKDKHSTFYQVFVGKGTMFEGKKGVKFQDVPNGVSNTIMVVEAGEAVPWTKPADLPYDAEKPLPKLGGMLKNIINVAMGDGSVRALPENFDEKTIRSSITRKNGKQVDTNELKP
jgi:uncharacterized protein (TIGR03067 family)